MLKYTEKVLLEILERIQSLTIIDINNILLSRNINIKREDLIILMLRLVRKRYIYKHLNTSNNNVIFSKSDYYFNTVKTSIDEYIVRMSKNDLCLYDNQTKIPKTLIVTITTKAPLNHSSFKNATMLASNVEVVFNGRGGIFKYTYVFSIKGKQKLLLCPNLNYINKLPNVKEDLPNYHYYYSLDIRLKEFISHRFNIKDGEYLRFTICNKLSESISNVVYTTYTVKNVDEDFQLIECRNCLPKLSITEFTIDSSAGKDFLIYTNPFYKDIVSFSIERIIQTVVTSDILKIKVLERVIV